MANNLIDGFANIPTGTITRQFTSPTNGFPRRPRAYAIYSWEELLMQTKTISQLREKIQNPLELKR